VTEPSTEEALKRLRAKITTKISVGDFHDECEIFLNRKRGSEELSDTRLSRGPLKKIIDEVFPVRRFLLFREISKGCLKFPLNNEIPDCWLWRDGAHTPLGIEVTVAQGRERHFLKSELDEKGIGRGFIGLQDDVCNADFKAALRKPRVTYSSDHALSAVKAGIVRCLRKKANSKYDDMMLLIQAPLILLSFELWEKIKCKLVAEARGMSFGEIYVIGDDSQRPFGFKIK
jgi:hypothetical protein